MSKSHSSPRISLMKSNSSVFDSPRIDFSTTLQKDIPSLRRKSSKFGSPLFAKNFSHDSENFQHFLSDSKQASRSLTKSNSTMNIDYQKVSSQKTKISSQKAVRFQSNLDEIEEDIDQDYLLGNIGKSLINPKSPKHIRSKTESQTPLKNIENPYLTHTPKDFVKNSFNYDPNFKKTFECFINGEVGLESLMEIKNFPSLYVFNENDRKKLSFTDHRKIIKNEKKEASPKSEKKQQDSLISSEENKENTSTSIKTELNSKNSVLKHFDQIKEIIKKRLFLKKKIKKEAFQLNDWNVKFFQNFYSITKEYIEKIKKKDLITVNVMKNYYEKDYPTAHRLMKNFTLMNYTKNPKISKTFADEDISARSKQMQQDYLRLNADSFLALLNKDVLEKLHKEKQKITVPHLSHFIKKITKSHNVSMISKEKEKEKNNHGNEKENYQNKKKSIVYNVIENPNETTNQSNNNNTLERKKSIRISNDTLLEEKKQRSSLIHSEKVNHEQRKSIIILTESSDDKKEKHNFERGLSRKSIITFNNDSKNDDIKQKNHIEKSNIERKKSIMNKNENQTEVKKPKNSSIINEKKSNVFTKRDQKLKDYINYQEDLDFFVKYNNINETGLFLNEISKLENFNDQYISRNLQNLKKNEGTLLRDLPSFKAKIKYENLKREYESKKNKKTVSMRKSNNLDERYYEIKRNTCTENNNNDLRLHELSEDDTSLPSLTEATLDNLYSASLEIQKKIIKKKDSGFAPRIRQFLKLEEISNHVEEANKQKLR